VVVVAAAVAVVVVGAVVTVPALVQAPRDHVWW
jgi:hypothetical protein